MPASMMMACVALSPKVTGSRIEMPESGPMPGSTPTSVPTRQPRNAYQRLSGWKATANPCARLRIVVSMRCRSGPLLAEGQARERRLQEVAEAGIGDEHDRHAVPAGIERIAPFDDHQKRENHDHQRDEEAGDR